MNKIGFNVLAWSAGMSDDILPVVDRLKATGYDGVEFYVGTPDQAAYQRSGNHCRDLGLEVTTVATVNKEENPISPDAAIRSKALDRLKWIVDRTHDLQANILCGPLHW